MRGTLAALATSAVLLAGCGEDTTAPTATPDEATTSARPGKTTAQPAALPACTKIWQEGRRLPADYEGCSGSDGATTAAKGVYCESGQMLFTYDKQLYAAAGRKVVRASPSLATDEHYQHALKACRA